MWSIKHKSPLFGRGAPEQKTCDTGVSDANDTFPADLRFDTKALRKAVTRLQAGDAPKARKYLTDWVDALLETQSRPEDVEDSRTQVNQIFQRCLKEAGIQSGCIAELGGPFNSDRSQYPQFDWEFLSLFPVEGRDDVKVCDITRADHIPDNAYDAIFSISVMEHVAQPWLAAEHMLRILKPGGVMFHVAPFSYFYHGAPADFWRYTPDGFEALFPSLRVLDAQILTANRRRDNRGSKAQPVDKDGGPKFAPDAFGGWRENWLAYYCGVNDAAHAAQQRETAQAQLAFDLMQQYIAPGASARDVAEALGPALRLLRIGAHGGLEAAGAGQGIQFSQQDIIDIWRGRTGLCLTPSYARHSLRHQFEHLAFGGSDNLPEGLQPRLKMKRLIARLLASEDTEI
ncbi:MAG: class I SAM-dependent methyltransferase [Oceanicola sp.]|nr:class I SAM-dependent methyltransferase [Oceanicola sp.]